MDRIKERIGPERRCEAKWVPVLRWVGAQVLKERLPPRFRVRRLRHAGPLGSMSLPQPSQRSVAPKRIAESCPTPAAMSRT